LALVQLIYTNKEEKGGVNNNVLAEKEIKKISLFTIATKNNT
jgi:hypothetical protein